MSENVPLKSKLQRYMYQNILQNDVYGDSIIVSGPDIVRHITDARSTFSPDPWHHIILVDNSPTVHNEQIDAFQKMHHIYWDDAAGNKVPIKKNVNLIFSDISDVQSQRIIDADLMGTYRSDDQAIVDTLKKQMMTLRRTERKAFIFTLAVRSVGKHSTLEWIENNVFGALSMNAKAGREVPMDIFGVDKKYSYIYQVYLDIKNFGRVIDVSLYHYRDNGYAMLTCCIVYI